MKKNNFKLSVVTVILIGLLFVIGVQFVGASSITVQTQAGAPATLWLQGVFEKFTKETGIEIEEVGVPQGRIQEKLMTEFIAGSGAYDVVIHEDVWMVDFALAGFIQPLNDIWPENDRADYVPASIEGVTFKGKIYSVPFYTQNSILFYRTDLFEEAGLTPPETWEEYIEAAKQLTQDTDGDGKIDIFGTIVEAKQHVQVVVKFLDRLYQAGGAVINENGQVVLDSEAAREAFQLNLDLLYKYKVAPPGALAYTVGDVTDMFLQGKLAMAPNWPYMAALAANPDKSKVAGKFDLVLQPGYKKQTTALSTWMFSIPTSSRKKEDAWKLIQYVTNVEKRVDFLKNALLYPSNRYMVTERIMADPDIPEFRKHAIQVMTNSVELGTPQPLAAGATKINYRLQSLIAEIIAHPEVMDEALKKAAADIEEIVK